MRKGLTFIGVTLIEEVPTAAKRLTAGDYVRVGLAVLWVVWAALAWWSAPRETTAEQFDADFAAGRIASYQTTDAWDRPAPWAAPARAWWNPDGPLLAWTNDNGQTFYTWPHQPVHAIAQELGFAGISHRSGTSPLAQTASVLGLALIIAGLLVLLGGCDPRRGTRWFWFWIGQIPLGLGYLAWLWFERPATAPSPEPQRRSGLLGFGVLLVSGFAVTALVIGARHVFGSWLVPGL